MSDNNNIAAPPADAIAITPKVIAEFADTAKIVATLKQRYTGIDPSAGKDEYDKCKKALHEMTKLRTGTQKIAKSLTDESKRWVKQVNADENRIVAAVLEVETPLRKAKEAVDETVENEKKAAEAAAKAKVEAEAKAKRDAEEAERQRQHAEQVEKIRKERAALEAERAKMLAEAKAEREAAAVELRKKQLAQDEARAKIAQEAAKVEADRLAVELERKRMADAEKARQDEEAADDRMREAKRNVDQVISEREAHARLERESINELKADVPLVTVFDTKEFDGSWKPLSGETVITELPIKWSPAKESSDQPAKFPGYGPGERFGIPRPERDAEVMAAQKAAYSIIAAQPTDAEIVAVFAGYIRTLATTAPNVSDKALRGRLEQACYQLLETAEYLCETPSVAIPF